MASKYATKATTDQTKKIAPTDKNPIPVTNNFVLCKGTLIDFNPNANSQLPVIIEAIIIVLTGCAVGTRSHT